MTDIHMPHDKYFKSSMSDLRVAKEFFQQHLPEEITKLINLDTLILRKESFVDNQLDIMLTDLLYSVEYKDQPSYIYILTEHQKQPDRFMAFRLLRYMIRIMNHHVQKQQNEQLPIVIPLVFYNGENKYPYSTDIFDLFDGPGGLAKKIMFQPFQLIDVGQIPDETLKQHQWAGIMEFIMKHVNSRKLLRRLEEILPIMRIATQLEGNEYIMTSISYLIAAGECDHNQLAQLITQNISVELGEKIMTTAERLIHQGIKEGVQKGSQQSIKIIARKCLSEGADIAFIARITNLSIAEVQQLQEETV